ncbi:D-glycerate 3-kinase [Klebsormidium nitens]|uniref:D-glycerate 3-kinase n=1 Tax=Klebsormidium nitens TaxID=105231 RepID=A0A1Y1INT7_KLENI|nr:D-glycerate 3-kinase [Klebsormidium nitens]|eukprot:GAQ90446.1 D-glycerate 3-kinase [Klebsormidium nitens]
MKASLSAQLGPTFVLGKPLTLQQSTCNPGSIECFSPLQLYTSLTNPKQAAGLRLPGQAWPVKGVSGRSWQRRHFEGLNKRLCLSRVEALDNPERTPDISTVFQTVPDLVAYICQGPLLSKVGANQRSVTEGLSSWVDLGVKVCTDLGFDPAALDEAQKSRIFHYYLPTFFWCRAQLEQHRQRHEAPDGASPPPLVIGISAPQGCGKSTIVEELTSLFEYVGSHCAGISLDDFYLTAVDQSRMAEFYEGNKLLQFRGNAGSHDMEFGRQSIETLLKLTERGSTAKVPRYDKSANQGRGDRADPATWPEVKGPLEVILFEGWMLGFRPVPTQQVADVDQQLIPVNAFLEHYAETFDTLVGAWVVIQVADPRWVFKWRLQAEHAMRAKGKTGMTDEQIEDFCARFQPAYKAYLPGLYKDGPPGAKPEATLQIRIDESRNVH